MTQIPDPYDVDWNVQAEGRGWKENALERYYLTPEKIEMMEGKLFGSDSQRLLMLGMLLENCGAETAVRFGDPEVWRRAVALLGDTESNLAFRVKAMLRQWDEVGTSEDAENFYSRWALPEFAEVRSEQRHNLAEVIASYPQDVDWLNWTSYGSNLLRIELPGNRAITQIQRQATTYRTIEQRHSHSISEERWELRWQQMEDGWLVAEAVWWTPPSNHANHAPS